MKISSKSETLPSVSQSGVDFQQIKNYILERSGLRVVPSQNNSQFFWVFFYGYNAAWTGFLLKYLECDVRAREQTFGEKVHLLLPVTCHVSCVTCNVSHVLCHMSHVIFFSPFFFGQSGEAIRWRVCYERGLPCLLFVVVLYNSQVVVTQQSELLNRFPASC